MLVNATSGCIIVSVGWWITVFIAGMICLSNRERCWKYEFGE